jgi:formylglycine-generating enzyme required for sulfatase activity
MRQFKDDSQMIYVPNGRFQMGSATGRPNEQPAHTVQLDGFYMDKYEVL